MANKSKEAILEKESEFIDEEEDTQSKPEKLSEKVNDIFGSDANNIDNDDSEVEINKKRKLKSVDHDYGDAENKKIKTISNDRGKKYFNDEADESDEDKAVGSDENAYKLVKLLSTSNDNALCINDTLNETSQILVPSNIKFIKGKYFHSQFQIFK